MSSPPFMPLYVADYHADTTHLNRCEHGAYLLLLMAMWRAGGKLPMKDEKLAKLAKCSDAEWAEIRETILAFFVRRGGSITHKRVTSEIAKYENRIVRARKGANATHLKKANNYNEKSPSQAPLKSRQPEPEPEPIERDISPIVDISRAGRPKRSRRCPVNWRFDPSVFDHGVSKGLTPDEIDGEVEEIRNYEFARPYQDWNGVAKRWLTRTVERRKSNHGRSHADAKQQATLNNYRNSTAGLAIASR